MSKTVQQVSYNDLINGRLYSIGEYGGVLVELGLFSTFEGFRQWHYKTIKNDVNYSRLFVKPLGKNGNNKIITADIKDIVRMLKGVK